MRQLVTLAALLAAAPAFAADPPKVWVDAPVPSVSTAPASAPADRAGRSSSSDNAAPFSAVPTGTATPGSSGTGTAAPSAGTDAGTPSLAR